jgi:starch phosphorylase
MELLDGGVFDLGETGILRPVIQSIREPRDPWMTAADFRSFVDAHRAAETAYTNVAYWTAMSIRNTAASGRFSTDRTIADYNRDIWRLNPIVLNHS